MARQDLDRKVLDTDGPGQGDSVPAARRVGFTLGALVNRPAEFNTG